MSSQVMFRRVHPKMKGIRISSAGEVAVAGQRIKGSNSVGSSCLLFTTSVKGLYFVREYSGDVISAKKIGEFYVEKEG